MTDEIVHFAGQTMTFGRITRQRCQWCGALIEEWDLDRIAMPEACRPAERRGKPIEPADMGYWNGLVAVSGTNPVTRWAVDDPEDGKAPDRSCMMLLPPEL